MTKHKLQLLIYLSAIGLSVSLFLPLASFPVYGEASYIRIAKLEAILVIIFAMAAPAFILIGREKFSILSPIAVWSVLLYPALRSLSKSSNETVLGKIGNELTSAMVDFSARLFLNISEFQWGGIILLASLVIFTLSNIVYCLKK